MKERLELLRKRSNLVIEMTHLALQRSLIFKQKLAFEVQFRLTGNESCVATIKNLESEINDLKRSLDSLQIELACDVLNPLNTTRLSRRK